MNSCIQIKTLNVLSEKLAEFADIRYTFLTKRIKLIQNPMHKSHNNSSACLSTCCLFFFWAQPEVHKWLHTSRG